MSKICGSANNCPYGGGQTTAGCSCADLCPGYTDPSPVSNSADTSPEETMSEMDKLESYLQFKSIHHDRIVYPSRDAEKVYFDQIIVFDDRGHPAWDAICYPGTYGYQRGLVEVKGSPVVKETDADTVVGFLTAEAIIHRMGDETYSDPTLRFHIKSRDYYAEAMELVDAFPDQKYNLLPEPVITYAVENNVRLIEAYLMYKRGELK